MSNVTQLLRDLQAGKTDAQQKLTEAVYDELRKMAAAKMRQERASQTLDATGLVHEAFLRMSNDQAFQSRRHFFGAASEAMRRILIDRARARKAKKRGGNAQRIEGHPDQFVIADDLKDERLPQLDEALTKFEALAPDKSELVRLRYFVGLSIREAAEILGISTATADRYWAYAKAWLQAEMSRIDDEPKNSGI